MAAFENLERLRQNLETNIIQLRKSLRYWQTWEFEYGGLKEELELVDHEPSTDEMLAIGVDLGLELVNEKEIKGLLNYGKKPSRSREQALNTIGGRIDTGQKNAASIQKQISVAEDKLEKVLLISEPAMEDEDGEALMDIFEELDDDGNVISSSVVNADKEQQALKAMFKGKGMLREEQKATEEDEAESSDGEIPAPASRTESGSMSQGKKVSFAQEPEIRKIPPVPSMLPYEPTPPTPRNMHPSQRMLVIDDDDNVIDTKPLEMIAPPTQDETIDYLREARQNAAEIAPIVASFDIESDSDSETDEDSDNEYGMNDIGAELTDDYKAEMEELMKKHASAFENVGPTLDQTVLEKLSNAHRDPKLIPVSTLSNGEADASKSISSNGKGVRFADDLDISPAPEPSTSASSEVLADTTPMEIDANPVSEEVIERSSSSNTTSRNTALNRKPSKFKQSMHATSNGASHKNAFALAAAGSTAPPPVIIEDTTNLPERPKKVSRFKAAKLGG